MKAQEEFTKFLFCGQPVRVIERDGQLWFHVIDVFCILLLANPFERLKELDPGETEYISLHTPFGEDGYTCVTKTGLFALGFKSGNPLAMEFCAWVISEAIPAMHKQGNAPRLRLVTPISAQIPDKETVHAL